jgi:hypothetical protein
MMILDWLQGLINRSSLTLLCREVAESGHRPAGRKSCVRSAFYHRPNQALHVFLPNKRKGHRDRAKFRIS